MKKDIATFVLQSLITVPAILAMMVLGFFTVAVGLLFKREFPETSKPFTVFHTDKNWMLVRLPKWLLWWDNTIDGFMGDKRGWYYNKTLKWPRFVSMWWWGAARNPSNYFQRFVVACDVTKCDIVKLAGKDVVEDDLENTGFQFIKATNRETGRRYYHLYWVHRWGTSNKGFNIQIGNKVKLHHATEKYEGDEEYKKYKGYTFEIGPYVTLS
jgi:hypothetical protein